MRVNVSVPELMVIAATRGALGIGLGLLLAPRFASAPRKAVGIALLSIGVLSTVPLAMHVFGYKPFERNEPQPEMDPMEHVGIG